MTRLQNVLAQLAKMMALDILFACAKKKDNGTGRVGPAVKNGMCLQHRMGTGQEQDCARGNGMGMGTGMKIRLNQILNKVLNTYRGDLFGAIITLCQFNLWQVQSLP
jgi:hypothetical protein